MKYNEIKMMLADYYPNRLPHPSLQLSNSALWEPEMGLSRTLPDLPSAPPSVSTRKRSTSLPGSVLMRNGHSGGLSTVHILNQLREANLRDYENFTRSEVVFSTLSKQPEGGGGEESVPLTDQADSSAVQYKQTDKDTTTSSSEMLS